MSMADQKVPDLHFNYLIFRAEHCAPIVNTAFHVLDKYFGVSEKPWIEGKSTENKIEELFQCVADDSEDLRLLFAVLGPALRKILESGSDKFIRKVEKETGIEHQRVAHGEEVWMLPGQVNKQDVMASLENDAKWRQMKGP